MSGHVSTRYAVIANSNLVVDHKASSHEDAIKMRDRLNKEHPEANYRAVRVRVDVVS